MKLSEDIAVQLAAIIASIPTAGGHIDNEAARYGGIALMGTIGVVWLLRSDRTLWEVDDESGRPLTPLAPEWHIAAIKCGARRYPWLASLVPPRPNNGVTCGACQGRGEISVQGNFGASGVLCPECYARGWRSPE